MGGIHESLSGGFLERDPGEVPVEDPGGILELFSEEIAVETKILKGTPRRILAETPGYISEEGLLNGKSYIRIS